MTSSSKILNSTSNNNENININNNNNLTPPESPLNNNNKLNTLLPTTRSIEAWRNLEIKLDKVINQLNYDHQNTSTSIILPNSSNSPSKSFKSTTNSNLPKSSLDSNISPSSTSSILHFTNSDDLTIIGATGKKQQISSKQPSKFKSFLRLRSPSTSNSTTSTTSSSNSTPKISSSSKRSNSSSRPTILRDQINIIVDPKILPTSCSPRPTPATIHVVLPTTTTIPVVAPARTLRKAQSLIQLSSSWFNKKFDSTSTTPVPVVPSLPSQFKHVLVATPDLIPLESTWNSPTFSFEDDSRNSTPTLVSDSSTMMSTPLSMASSSFSTSTGRFINPPSPQSLPFTESPPQPNISSTSTTAGPIDLLISFSHRFRNNLSTNDNNELNRNGNIKGGIITDEELISWRKDVVDISSNGVNDGNGMIKRSRTPLGERIYLSPRKLASTTSTTRKTTFGREEPEDEQEGEEETLVGLGFDTSSSSSDSISTSNSNSSSNSSSHHEDSPYFHHHHHHHHHNSNNNNNSTQMSRNPSQSPSLPPSYNRPRGGAPILIRSVSTSSLPSAYRRLGTGLGVPTTDEFGGLRTLNRKLSFTPISIPASPSLSGSGRSLTPTSTSTSTPMLGIKRRLELVEVFPLPPIRM